MAPIAGGRLVDGQRRERGSLRAQHPRAEPDAANKREFAQSVKLRLVEPTFGADEERRRPGRMPRRGFADRFARAALVTEDKTPAFGPAGEYLAERLRRPQVGHRQPPALLGRLDG